MSIIDVIVLICFIFLVITMYLGNSFCNYILYLMMFMTVLKYVNEFSKPKITFLVIGIISCVLFFGLIILSICRMSLFYHVFKIIDPTLTSYMIFVIGMFYLLLYIIDVFIKKGSVNKNEK